MRNCLINGDCLEAMKEIDQNSVHLVLTDLPYGITNASWDSLINLDLLWEQINRVLTKNGTSVFTATQPFTTDLINSNRTFFRYAIVWEKSKASGFLDAKNKPLRAHEDILIFSNGSASHEGKTKNRMTYNPQMRHGSPYKKKRGIAISELWGRHKDLDKDNHGNRYPTTVMFCENGNYQSLHPTQKPVNLFEELIRTFSNEGDTVLDCCAGSGTTAIACINAKRNYICIEKTERYYNVAKKRISEYCEQKRLF